MGIKDGIANTPEKRTRYCDAILTRADDLERLTGSLSLLVKMDTGSSFLHLERVNLDEYIKQFLSEKEAWLSDRKVDVRYRTDSPQAEADLDIREMQRVFMNLLENTVRYRTADCSIVDIEVWQNKENVEIRFSDDGPGVGLRHLDRLFDPFYRADQSRTTPEKGSGIGLTIVKRIIEGHGGQVSASSESGLCITMTLPSVKGEGKHEEDTDR
jgi:signal transduction histidine kinase